MDPENASGLYDAHYYATSCGRPYARDEEWLAFFGRIAGQIANTIQPATVLDAGCAWGLLVEALRGRGVEAYGVDISEYAIQQVAPEVRPYCRVGSVTAPFPQRYGLITCIEVLEHMPQAEAEKAVENFCAHTDDVLFSSTPFDYKEATHFNVQPPEYWAELFARQGLFRDVDFDASFITPWAVRFRRKAEPVARLVREYERRYFLLSKENSDLRALSVETRNQLSALAEQLQQKDELAAHLDRKAGLLELQLNEMRNSASWKLIQKFQALRLKLIPQGSGRERILFKLIGK